MNAVPNQKKSIKRGLWILIFVLAFIIFGGTGGWFYAAGKFEDAVQNFQQRLAAKDQTITCDNQQIRGFPFRIGVFCDQISIEDGNKGQKLTSGALRTAAQIYDPGKFIVEFDGPAQFSDANLGQFRVDWQFLRSSISANLGGIERTSIVSNATTIHVDQHDTPFLSAETLELHARKFGDDDLEMALGGRNLILAIETNASETVSKPFQVSLQMTANDTFNLVQQNRNLISHLRENGGSGHLNAFKLEASDGGVLQISGPVSVGTDGQLSAKFEVSITGLKPLLRFISGFTPVPDATLDQIELAMDMFAPETGSENSRNILIQIENGNVLLGLLPVGSIPPLF